MDSLHLVHRHPEVVRFSEVERHRVEPDTGSGFRGDHEAAVEVVIELVRGGEPGRVEFEESGMTLGQVSAAAFDPCLGVVGPPVVKPREPARRADLGVLRYPAHPILIEERAEFVRFPGS